MSNSRKNLLVSGCGITYNSANHKTWTTVMKAVGYNIIDVSGPAVSNQWILNKTILKLLSDDCKIDAVVIQLTGLGKLDVMVDHARSEKLVKNDPLRNFIIHPNFRVTKTDEFEEHSVWPSSVSQHHVSKQQWKEWLYSPMLEIEDLFCKLSLLSNYCNHKKIPLLVFQGYELPWPPEHHSKIETIVKNFDRNFYQDYTESMYYQFHNFENYNTVPCFQFQCEIARRIVQWLDTGDTYAKILKIQEKLNNA